MSIGNKVLNDTALYSLLEADGIAELKSKLIDMIVEEVREQLQQSSEYIISPDNICQDIYEDTMKEIKNEVRDEYKRKIMEKLDMEWSKL